MIVIVVYGLARDLTENRIPLFLITRYRKSGSRSNKRLC